MLIDEGNLLAMTKLNAKELKSQMEVIKSLAASTPKTRFVFFATSDALPLLHLSPQLSRRVIVIRFDPYASSKEDLQAFGDAILPYLEAVPGRFDFDLRTKIRTIQQTVSGLYGVATEWIQRAAVDPIRENRAMSWADMEKAMPDPHTIRALKRDVDDFKRFFNPPAEISNHENGGEDSGKKNHPATRRGRVGSRKAKRDPRTSNLPA